MGLQHCGCVRGWGVFCVLTHAFMHLYVLLSVNAHVPAGVCISMCVRTFQNAARAHARVSVILHWRV